MKKLKTFFLFVLSCCLLFSLSTSIFAAEFHPMAYGVFNGHISADSDSHNLEQIEIKVYSSILSQQNNIERRNYNIFDRGMFQFFYLSICA